MGISQAQKFIFLCHWVMHFLRCNQWDFQVVTIENEDSSGFRLELAKHGESGEQGRRGPCPHGPKEATRWSGKGVWPGRGGASIESLGSCFFCVLFCFDVKWMDCGWIEWNAYGVPDLGLRVRCRMNKGRLPAQGTYSRDPECVQQTARLLEVTCMGSFFQVPRCL